MKGQRREDVRHGELPEDVQPGDYWRYLSGDGEPLRSTDPGNLTGGVWGVAAPNGAGIGNLVRHTVREHEDGTISVRPGDGSSNSIFIAGGPDGKQYHGYIERGEWRAV